MLRIIHSVFILSMLPLVTACDEKPKEQKDAPLRPVRTIVASASDGITGRDFPGVVIAEKKADLAFRISGKLKELLVKESAQVKKGQVIARLDQTDFKIELEDKKANYEKAKANFTRSAKLVEPGHISKREFDEIKATYSTADAHLKAARQNLIYTELKAPFDGNITKTYVDNFEEVQAKSTIATLQDLTSMEIEIDVPESLMIRAKRSDAATRYLYATFDAIKDKKFPLKVREVSAQADETTHAYKVRLSLPAIENFSILPGMTATVAVDRVKASDGRKQGHDIIIPSHAVMEDRKGRFVYIAEPDPASPQIGVIHRRDVTTSKLSNIGLVVTSGLNQDDRVVVAGMSKMQEGLKVKLMLNPEQLGSDH